MSGRGSRKRPGPLQTCTKSRNYQIIERRIDRRALVIVRQCMDCGAITHDERLATPEHMQKIGGTR